MDTPGVEIPWEKLDPETLRRVIEEFVTRQETDPIGDLPLTTKVATVHRQLVQGTAIVLFDPGTESCAIVRRDGT